MKDKSFEFTRWKAETGVLTYNRELGFLDGKLFRSVVEDSTSIPKLPYHYYIKIERLNGDVEIYRGASINPLKAIDFGFNVNGYEVFKQSLN